MRGQFAERDVINPKGIVQVYRDYWWWCVEGDPTRAIVYKFSPRHVGLPQCNAIQAHAEAVGKKQRYPPGAQLIQIPLAFMPWDQTGDYSD